VAPYRAPEARPIITRDAWRAEPIGQRIAAEPAAPLQEAHPVPGSGLGLSSAPTKSSALWNRTTSPMTMIERFDAGSSGFRHPDSRRA